MKPLMIAIRNIKRNKRRTAITMITIVIGVFVIVLTRGIMKGFQNETITNMIELRTGDIQIHKSGYRQTLDILPLDLSIPMNEVADGLSHMSEIQEFSGRILFSGQLTTPEESAMLFGQAIDVEKEIVICPRLKDNMDFGEFLKPEDSNAIVITQDLQKKLKIKMGDSLLLFAVSKEGAINATELIVKGIFHAELPDTSKNLGYIPLKTAQKLLLMDGIVTEIVMKLKKNQDVVALADDLKKKFPAKDLEINTWLEIEQGFLRMVENQNMLSIAVSIILFIIVFSTVMNTMLMIVLERTREIGTMLAIGFKKRHILSLFVFEGFFLGLLGGIIGVAMATAIVSILNRFGIPFYTPGSTGISFIVRPDMDFGIILLALSFSIIAAVTASIYPANRASKMDPVEALRSA